MVVAVTAASFLGGAAAAEDAGSPRAQDAEVVELHDGSRLVGHVLGEDAERLRLRTLGGIEVEVPMAAIASRRPLPQRRGRDRRRDPDASRLMFAPTGRPLARGDGYVADYELVFPGVAYGVTDHFSLAGGVSLIPGLGLGRQFAYIAPRLGRELSDRLAVSAAALLAADGQGEHSLGAAFGVATFGPPERSLSAGVGVLRSFDSPRSRTRALLMVGGQLPLAPSLALVSETWLGLGGRFDAGEQPFGLAFRLAGERISADLGVIVVPEHLDEGFPIPWVSVSYRLGRPRDGQADPLLLRSTARAGAAALGP